MEGKSARFALLAAVAPTAWGTTYFVTSHLLPPGRPLFAAMVRALPIGLALLAIRRELPKGIWWWRAIVLGLCNIGMFMPLLFLGAYRLPGGLAATLQAMSPLAVMAIAWLLIAERARLAAVVGAIAGLAGVALLVTGSPGSVDLLGLAAGLGSVLVSALGFVLIKRWKAPTDMLTLVSWQLVVGGLALVPIAFLVEGAPPPIDGKALAGFAWLSVVGTGLAYFCWFTALTRLPAGAVSLIGLLNPVVGTVLGVVLAGEAFGWVQALGTALVLGGVLAGQPAIWARVSRARRIAAAERPESGIPSLHANSSEGHRVVDGLRPCCALAGDAGPARRARGSVAGGAGEDRHDGVGRRAVRRRGR